jgi:hypothetical protein
MRYPVTTPDQINASTKLALAQWSSFIYSDPEWDGRGEVVRRHDMPGGVSWYSVGGIVALCDRPLVASARELRIINVPVGVN